MSSLANDPAFRQRKYYWRKKGLSEEAALEKAMNSQKSGVRPQVALTQEPVRMPQRLQIPPDCTKNGSRRFDLHAFPALLGYAIFVGACSYLLVSYTATALRAGLSGWSQATLLELGAIVLSVVRPHSMFKNLTCKLTSASLLILTLALLHGTSQGSFDKTSRQESGIQTNLQNQQAQQAALKQQLSLIPETHLTRRQLILDKIDAQNLLIAASLTQLTSSQNLTTLTSRHYTELALRVALVLMNLLFASLLVDRWREAKGARAVTSQTATPSFSRDRVLPKLSLVKTGSLAFAVSVCLTLASLFTSPSNMRPDAWVSSSLGALQ